MIPIQSFVWSIKKKNSSSLTWIGRNPSSDTSIREGYAVASPIDLWPVIWWFYYPILCWQYSYYFPFEDSSQSFHSKIQFERFHLKNLFNSSSLFCCYLATIVEVVAVAFTITFNDPFNSSTSFLSIDTSFWVKY